MTWILQLAPAKQQLKDSIPHMAHQQMPCGVVAVVHSCYALMHDQKVTSSQHRMYSDKRDLKVLTALAQKQLWKQSINQLTFPFFRTHQGSQPTITGKTTYTKH